MEKNISFEDFTKIDIRIGTIINVEDFPKAKKPAYKLTIDFGHIGIKKSSAQITDLYTKTDLLNKQIIAVINFEKKQIANFFSECLVLGIANTNNKIVLLKSDNSNIKNGSQIA